MLGYITGDDFYSVLMQGVEPCIEIAQKLEKKYKVEGLCAKLSIGKVGFEVNIPFIYIPENLMTILEEIKQIEKQTGAEYLPSFQENPKARLEISPLIPNEDSKFFYVKYSVQYRNDEQYHGSISVTEEKDIRPDVDKSVQNFK